MHVHQLDRVFCRFTIHRNAIMNIKYLPKAKVFLSICSERHLKIWRINNKEKKVNVIYSFRLEKEIDFFWTYDFPEKLVIFKNPVLIGLMSLTEENFEKFEITF